MFLRSCVCMCLPECVREHIHMCTHMDLMDSSVATNTHPYGIVHGHGIQAHMCSIAQHLLNVGIKPFEDG